VHLHDVRVAANCVGAIWYLAGDRTGTLLHVRLQKLDSPSRGSENHRPTRRIDVDLAAA
jgi:hypothetical protein